MKRFFPLLALALNGCFACGTGSRVEEVDPDLRLYRPAAPPLDDRHASARLDAVPPGSWVRYRIARDGSDTIVTLGAVRVDGHSLWVEVVEEGDPKRASLRRIRFDGEITEARYREIPASGPPSEVADQPITPGTAAFREPPSSETEETKQLTVATKSLEATVLRRIYRDESVGREYEVEEAWSKDVPPLFEDSEASDAVSGLVYRKSKGRTIDLLDWGTGYTALIP